MQSSDIEILILSDSEIEKANDFYNSIYKTSRTIERFKWEFRESPAMAGIYVVAKDKNNGKIVGSQAAIPIYLKTADGASILTAKSEDTLVDPAYRGLSIFENMYKLLFKECDGRGIKFIWGFTYAVKPFTKLGFDIPFEVGQSLMVFDIGPASRYLVEYNRTKTNWAKFKSISLSLASKMLSLKTLIGKDRCNFLSSEVKREELGEFQQLADSVIRRENLFIIRQDEDYLRWRISNNPYHDDIFFVQFRDQREIVAGLIFNHHKSGVWYLTQELYSAGLDETQKKSIFLTALKKLRTSRKGKVSMLRTWDFQHNAVNRDELKFRKSAGFIKVNLNASFVWRSLGESNMLNPSNFLLSRIASEGKI